MKVKKLGDLSTASKRTKTRYREHIKKKMNHYEYVLQDMDSGRVLLGILGGGVPPGPSNPDPVSGQKM